MYTVGRVLLSWLSVSVVAWYTVHDTFLLIRGYQVLGVHKHVPKGVQWKSRKVSYTVYHAMVAPRSKLVRLDAA